MGWLRPGNSTATAYHLNVKTNTTPLQKNLFLSGLRTSMDVVEILKWMAVVFVAGFIGYFGKYLSKLIISKLHKKKEVAIRLPYEKESKYKYKLEKERLKLEKKKLKLEKKKLKKENT